VCCYIFLLEIKGEHDTTTSCSAYKPKTQREHNTPHVLPFVVGFAIRNAHTHTQTRKIIKPKGKKEERE